MDMDMVWATMVMDIDMVVMDMQLTGHMDMDIMESSSAKTLATRSSLCDSPLTLTSFIRASLSWINLAS